MMQSIEATREFLLNTKALPARPADAPEVLARIMRLNIEEWSEADVRAEIIDPLIRILGYDKESYFSLDREKTVEVLGGHKALDYNMTLFAENFWLIEAKRPGRAENFDRDALYQALRYAAHPDVNAALLVLCDGNKIEVFDREESLREPLLHIARADFDRDFDKLRALLLPWQAFFFERRRVLRLIDKTFDNENHLSRLEEFRAAIDRRLIEKRARILQNSRERIDHEVGLCAHIGAVGRSDPAQLVDADFFVIHSKVIAEAMTARLVTCANELPVLVTNRILPDSPRPANAAFWANALSYLIGLEQAGLEHEPIPVYLATAGRTPYAALTQLIPMLLTNFAADAARQVIILYSAAARRVAKLAMILDNRSRSLGELLHFVERAHGDELTFAQAVSSPERHLLLALDSIEITATMEFVRRHTDGRRAFQKAAAQQELREFWAREIAMLRRVPNYHELARARYGDECHLTAACSVAYDCLGHNALCVLEPHGAWKTWTLQHYPALVEGMAELGSWQARKWLGEEIDTKRPPASDATLAGRFFFGDAAAAQALLEGYGFLGRP